MATEIATATITEFNFYKDVILKVSTSRGSTPVFIVLGGVLQDAEAIGKEVLSCFDYLVGSEVFNDAK